MVCEGGGWAARGALSPGRAPCSGAARGDAWWTQGPGPFSACGPLGRWGWEAALCTPELLSTTDDRAGQRSCRLSPARSPSLLFALGRLMKGVGVGSDTLVGRRPQPGVRWREHAQPEEQALRSTGTQGRGAELLGKFLGLPAVLM